MKKEIIYSVGSVLREILNDIVNEGPEQYNLKNTNK